MSHDIRRSRRLVLMAAMMTLVSGTAAAQGGANNRTVNGPVSGSPCDVLASGGTVFDTRECDLLRSTGVVRHGDRWTALAGRTLSLRLVSKDAKAVLGDVPVGVYRRTGGDRTPVAQARTGADGTFRLSLPVSLNGEFVLLSPSGGGPADPAEILVCDGNGNCFDFCPLPSMPTTMEPMCVEDTDITPILRVAPPGGPGRR